MYRKLSIYACILVIGIFVLHMLATAFYWYTAIFGFDKVMHALGGMFLAVSGGAFFLKQTAGISVRNTFVTLVLWTFVVGLAWEYYEYVVQFYIKSVHLADIPDSIGDLIFDCVGGSIGAGFVIMVKKRYNHK